MDMYTSRGTEGGAEQKEKKLRQEALTDYLTEGPKNMSVLGRCGSCWAHGGRHGLRPLVARPGRWWSKQTAGMNVQAWLFSLVHARRARSTQGYVVLALEGVAPGTMAHGKEAKRQRGIEG